MIRRAKKSAKLQKVWRFMRKNRAFCINELMLAVDIDRSYLKSFIWHLENSGYLKRVCGKRLEERCYRLVRDSGVIVPKAANGEVYDYNLERSFLLEGRLKKIWFELLKGIEAEEVLREYIDDFSLMEYKRILIAGKKGDRLELIDEIVKSISGGGV
jgi:hypothetical protein